MQRLSRSKVSKLGSSHRPHRLWPVAALLLATCFGGCFEGNDTDELDEPTEHAQEPINAPNLTLNTDNCTLTGQTQQLWEYANQCTTAIGAAVPAFDCDDGSVVDEGNETGIYPNGHCDRPNVLNGECDPGSRFQVLESTNPDVLMVAHCRKKSLPLGQYGDIAVIQYNKVNGNTCFYQSKSDPGFSISGVVKAPGDSTNNTFMTPAATASQNCVRCHDNGPFVRSPYLTHLKDDPAAVAKGDVLPGSHDPGWNKTLPYRFVGSAFQSWKTFSVVLPPAAGSTCADCHRMAVSATNNAFNVGSGTSLSFGLISTAQLGQPKKNVGAPMWMKFGQLAYDANVELEAKKYQDAATAFLNGGNTGGLVYTEFGRGNTCTGPVDGGTINGSLSGDPPSFHQQGTVVSGYSPPSTGGGTMPGPPAFAYWETIHGPFWQTSPASVPLGSANYRGSYLRAYETTTHYLAYEYYSDSTGLTMKAAPGGILKYVNFSEFTTSPPNLAGCGEPISSLIDVDGTHSSSSSTMGPAQSFVEVFTGFVGNVSQTNGSVSNPRADYFKVSSGSTYTQLSQVHQPVSGGGLVTGYMRGESMAPSCSGWTPTYLAKGVYSTNDVLLLANPGSKKVRCFLTGITGAWSSSRISGSTHSEPFAEVYQDASKNYRLRVFPDDSGAPPAVDRVGAYAACIQL